MKKLLIILFLLNSLNQIFAQKKNYDTALTEIDNLYQNKEEEEALRKIGKYKEDHEKEAGFDILPFLRWEVRIYYELWDTEKATDLLIQLMDLDSDLNYEQFPDKQVHFRTFFEKVQEENDTDVVFVNKFKENVALSPAVVTVYKEEEIRRLGARHLMDLVRLTPGFAEIGDNNERNFGTRGVYGTTVQHILVLINGHRVNDLLTSSADPGWFTLDYVQQVEFMRGPGSALYGGNAFSGVINIITKSAKTFRGSQVSVTSGSSQLFDGDLSDHVYKLNFQHGALMNDQNRLYFSGSIQYDGGTKYRYDREQQPPAEVFPDIRSASQDTIPPNLDGTEYINRYLPGYNFLVNYEGNNFNLTANAQRSQFVINRPNSNNLWNDDQSDNEFAERKRIDSREFLSLDYTLFPNKIANGALDLKISFDRFRKDLPIHQYANFDPSPLDSSKTRLFGNEYRWTAGLEYQVRNWKILPKSWRLLEGKESQTIMGIQTVVTDWFYSYQAATTDPNSYDYDPSVNFFDDKNSEDYSAFFFQQVNHLINNRLIATTGFRLNYHPIYSNFSKFRWGDEISPRLSLVYLAKDKEKRWVPGRIKLLYNSAFLPPAFLYRLGGIVGFRGATEGLESQTIESSELSISGRITPELNYSLNYFINRIENFISRTGNVYANETSLRRISGWEAELKWEKEIAASRFSTSGFFNISTFDYHVSPQNQGLFNTWLNKGFAKSDSIFFPPLTVYASIMGVYKDFTQRVKSISLGLSVNHFARTNVPERVTRESEDRWVVASTTGMTSSQAPIFNLNAILEWNRMNFGISIHNLFNTKYELPSPISTSGRTLGERQSILFNYTYLFGGKYR